MDKIKSLSFFTQTGAACRKRQVCPQLGGGRGTSRYHPTFHSLPGLWKHVFNGQNPCSFNQQLAPDCFKFFQQFVSVFVLFTLAPWGWSLMHFDLPEWLRWGNWQCNEWSGSFGGQLQRWWTCGGTWQCSWRHAWRLNLCKRWSSLGWRRSSGKHWLLKTSSVHGWPITQHGEN